MIYNLNKAQDSCNAPRIKSKGTRLLELIGRDIFLRMLLLHRLLLLCWRREAQAGLEGLWHLPASSSRHARLVPTEQPWEYHWQQQQSHLHFIRTGFVDAPGPLGCSHTNMGGTEMGGQQSAGRARGRTRGVKAPAAPCMGRKMSQLTFYVKLIPKLISGAGRIIGFHSGAGPDGQCAESQTHLISTETMPEDRNKTHKDNY